VGREEKAVAGKETYSQVVERLQRVVDDLEGGDLSLEDSLDKFSEGVRLVKKGEALLSEAEKRVEQLLSEEGATAPLDVDAAPASSRPGSRPAGAPRKPDAVPAPRLPVPPEVEDDVPF
jgi:exodeoxyribonuclease VII small subunit